MHDVLEGRGNRQCTLFNACVSIQVFFSKMTPLGNKIMLTMMLGKMSNIASQVNPRCNSR